MMEQHFLGFDVELPPDLVDDMRLWWRNFELHPPDIPSTDEGEYRPEMSLTVPVGKHFLYGICDLLVLSDTAVHIVDWKTERNPRSAETLQNEWQTRLYLMMLAEGGTALGRTYAPEQIKLTYWFARAPEKSVTIHYDTVQHTRNWAELTAEVERIERRLAVPNAIWPLTDDWSKCETCRFQGFCGRVQDVRPSREAEEAAEEALSPILEPDVGN